MPLALVSVLFPVVAQLAAVAGGERAMRGGSLALPALVLAASLVPVTGRRGDPAPVAAEAAA